MIKLSPCAFCKRNNKEKWTCPTYPNGIPKDYEKIDFANCGRTKFGPIALHNSAGEFINIEDTMDTDDWIIDDFGLISKELKKAEKKEDK